MKNKKYIIGTVTAASITTVSMAFFVLSKNDKIKKISGIVAMIGLATTVGIVMNTPSEKM